MYSNGAGCMQLSPVGSPASRTHGTQCLPGVISEWSAEPGVGRPPVASEQSRVWFKKQSHNNNTTTTTMHSSKYKMSLRGSSHPGGFLLNAPMEKKKHGCIHHFFGSLNLQSVPQGVRVQRSVPREGGEARAPPVSKLPRLPPN